MNRNLPRPATRPQWGSAPYPAQPEGTVRETAVLRSSGPLHHRQRKGYQNPAHSDWLGLLSGGAQLSLLIGPRETAPHSAGFLNHRRGGSDLSTARSGVNYEDGAHLRIGRGTPATESVKRPALHLIDLLDTQEAFWCFIATQGKHGPVALPTEAVFTVD